MAKNLFKDNDTEAAKKTALEKLQQAKAEIQQIEAYENEKRQDEIDAQKAEKAKLLVDAQRFRDDALNKAQNGDLTGAKDLRQFAFDAEKKASEILIEGEIQLEKETEKNPLFGQGVSLKKILVFLSSFVIFLGIVSGYVNHTVKYDLNDVKSLSISIGAEWVHAMLTTQYWSMAWLLGFMMLYLLFRTMSRFINPKEHPEFDLTTKLFNECSAYQQILVSLYLLLSMVLSWVLMYLHSPVANRG